MDTVTLELSFLFIWIFCLHFRRRLILAYKTNQAKRIATWKIYFVYFLYAGFIMINLIILAHIIIVCSTVEAFREFNWYFISFFYWTDYAFRCFRYLRNEGVDLGWFFFFFLEKIKRLMMHKYAENNQCWVCLCTVWVSQAPFLYWLKKANPLWNVWNAFQSSNS